MQRRTIVGGGAFALTILALVCIPRHLPSSASPPSLIPANFHARLEHNQLTLRGSLPDADIRDGILRQAHSVYDPARIHIIDELTVDRQIAPAPWLTPLPSLLPLLGQMDGRGSVIIDGRSLVLTGQVPSKQVKDKILRTLAPVTSLGLELEDHILASATTTEHPSLQAKLNEFLSRNQIEFDSNQSTLTARGRAVLDQLVPLLQEFPGASIEIGGHTDGFGAPAYNMELSRRRAETVRQYLVNRGLPHRFTAVGYGASKPRSTEITKDALRRNRRIELLVQEQGDL